VTDEGTRAADLLIAGMGVPRRFVFPEALLPEGCGRLLEYITDHYKRGGEGIPPYSRMLHAHDAWRHSPIAQERFKPRSVKEERPAPLPVGEQLNELRRGVLPDFALKILKEDFPQANWDALVVLSVAMHQERPLQRVSSPFNNHVVFGTGRTRTLWDITIVIWDDDGMGKTSCDLQLEYESERLHMYKAQHTRCRSGFQP
jgi:hypothetical protein